MAASRDPRDSAGAFESKFRFRERNREPARRPEATHYGMGEDHRAISNLRVVLKLSLAHARPHRFSLLRSVPVANPSRTRRVPSDTSRANASFRFRFSLLPANRRLNHHSSRFFVILLARFSVALSPPIEEKFEKN